MLITPTLKLYEVVTADNSYGIFGDAGKVVGAGPTFAPMIGDPIANVVGWAQTHGATFREIPIKGIVIREFGHTRTARA